MRVPRYRDIALAVFIAAISPAAAAQCAGFTDLPTFSSFCGNVIWMRNRGVTQGCTATTYCPGSEVTRLSMAAFLNRVGNVLSPQVHSIEDSGGAQAIFPAVVLCETPTIPGVDYLRTAQVDAALSFEVTGQQDVFLAVAWSRNGGAWQVPQDALVPLVSAGERQQGTVMLSGHNLADGPTVNLKFGLYVTRGSGGMTQSLASWACHLNLQLRNAAETP